MWCFCLKKKIPSKFTKILPGDNLSNIDKIYSKKDESANWSTFVLGRDKRFVLSIDNLGFIGDHVENLYIKDLETDTHIVYFTAMHAMMMRNDPKQVMVVYDNNLYISNVYVFLNANSDPIGGIVSLRRHTDDDTETNDSIFTIRKSQEYKKAVKVIKQYNAPLDDIPEEVMTKARERIMATINDTQGSETIH